MKYGISNLTVIGARLSKDSCSIEEVKSQYLNNVHCVAKRRRTTANAGETEVCTHEELATTSQLLDLPHKCRLIRDVLHATC